MTEIYLVRHPESAQNTDRSIVGGRSNKTPITERGAEQSRRFAKAFLAQYPAPDAFYTSPAVRTQTLLDIYNETTGQHNGYFIDSGLQEISQGQSEGLIRSNVYTPEVLASIAKLQHDFALPGGESLNDVATRMLTTIHKIERRHPHATVLVATHGIAIRALLGSLLGWNHFQTTLDPEHDINNVALTHITVENSEALVHFWGKEIIEPVEIKKTEVY